jgi:hypothetical protein
MLPRIPRRANPLGRGPFGPAVDRGRLRHIESSGRSPEERRAAAEARARARAEEPTETGDEERLREAGPRGARGEMSRLYGGGDAFRRRRLIAVAAIIIVVLLLLFLLVGGC